MNRLIAAILSVFLSLAAGAEARQATPGEAPSPPTEPAPAPADDGIDPDKARDTAHYNLVKNKPAIKGYDPVAYFPEGGGNALKGSDKFAYRYRGVLYHFASVEHRDLFKKDPRRYEPAYGGWCATAMADRGKKVEIDPKAFIVTGGRLFLFYKGLFQNALDTWKKDEPGQTAAADTEWRRIAGEEPRKPDEPEPESPGDEK